MNVQSRKISARVTAALGAVALAMLMLAGSAFAASQVTMGPNDNPAKAAPLDTAAHTIAPAQAQWFHFQFSGSDGTNAVLSLPGGSHSGLQFQVYSAGQTNDWTSEDPTGVGNVEENGDLAWANQIDGSRMWYLRVLNSTGQSINYQFSLTGATLVAATSGNTIPSTTTPGSTTPSTTTPSTTTPGNTTPSTTTPGGTTSGTTNPASVTPGANTTPATAAPLDMNLHSVGANQSAWYRFTLYDTKGQYSILSLPGAAQSGIRFEIYSQDQLANWSEQDPAGRSNVDDNNNLTWAVQSDTRDAWYVRVINANAQNANFQFTMTGPFSAP
jgi:hypothetical protein